MNSKRKEGIGFDMDIMFFLVSLIATIVGAICGIGGGVIIKPVLDMLRLADVVSISFLSGVTVLCMSCYSVTRAIIQGTKEVNFATGTPLAVGAAAGGVAGKLLFTSLLEHFAGGNMGAIQNLCLFIITLGTLAYTVNKTHIHTYTLTQKHTCILVGGGLGLLSSFLGIGGGPVNLVVLYFFFSMDTKKAAQNSLYIILFSQAASLILTAATGTLPEFSPLSLVLMISGGVLGGMIGGVLYKRMSNKGVEKMFLGVMVLIIGISALNIWQSIR